VTAIWGLESAYGTYRGSTPIIEALATLAHDGRRGAFFEAQLIARSSDRAGRGREPARDDRKLGRGDGAHAVHPDLLPRPCAGLRRRRQARHLVGRSDRRARLAAAYLAGFGWTKGQPWGVEVRLPQGFDYAQTGERIKKSPADWAAMGVRDTDGNRVPDHGRASILLPAGARGAAFMIFDNFHVIERYNTADAYVIGVGHLSDRIRGAGPLRSGWPREDRNLRFAEKQEMQERLTQAGFDTQGVDGVIGPTPSPRSGRSRRRRG
jgi:membrane-bound lytic murein transglycosylase B